MEASMLMTLEVTPIPPELPLSLAHQLMLKLRTRHLPVVSNSKLAGLVSDRDLLQKMTQIKPFPLKIQFPINNRTPFSARPMNAMR